MGDGNVSHVEVPKGYRAGNGNDVESYVARKTGFLKFSRDQSRGERRGVHGTSQPGPKIGNGTDVIFVSVGQKQTQQILRSFFNKPRIGKNDVDTGHGIIGKRNATVDHDPFPAEPIQVEVHTDFARPSQGQKYQLVAKRLFRMRHAML